MIGSRDPPRSVGRVATRAISSVAVVIPYGLLSPGSAPGRAAGRLRLRAGQARRRAPGRLRFARDGPRSGPDVASPTRPRSGRRRACRCEPARDAGDPAGRVEGEPWPKEAGVEREVERYAGR